MRAPQFAFLILLLPLACAAGVPDVERARLVRVLTDAAGRRDWVGVHAGEALVAVGRPELAKQAFAPQSETNEPAYRIGVWRVLARAESDPLGREAVVERIRDVLLDEGAPDRVHAMETLAKLNEPIVGDAEARAVAMMARDPSAAPFALWRLAQAGDESARERLAGHVRGSDPVGKARAEYVLSRMHAAATRPSAATPGVERAEQRRRLERQLAGDDADGRVAAALELLQMEQPGECAATTQPQD